MMMPLTKRLAQGGYFIRFRNGGLAYALIFVSLLAGGCGDHTTTYKGWAMHSKSISVGFYSDCVKVDRSSVSVALCDFETKCFIKRGARDWLYIVFEGGSSICLEAETASGRAG